MTGRMDDDTQVKLAAALTRISSLEREVDTKQRLLEDAAAETERVRDGLERVIKELVAKNRTMDNDLRRIQAQHESEMTDVLRAHESTVADLTDSRKQNAVLREANTTHTAQLATASAINRDMSEDLEMLKHRRLSAEQALLETQRQLEMQAAEAEDARRDVDDMIQRLQRADQHLVTLTEEATASSVTASRLKAHAQQLASERDAALRGKEELVMRIKQPAASLAELVRNLMRDVDAALRDAQGVIDGGKGAAASSGRSPSRTHRSSTPAWMEDGSADSHHHHLSLPRLWPSNTEGLDDASCIVLALSRIADVVPVLSEDIALVRRTISETLRREGDEQQQLNVVRDALSAERAHVAELADAARNGAEALKQAEAETASLRAALQDTSQWMAEAAQIGEERARRAENLALTIRSMEQERSQLVREVTTLREELHHAKLLSDVSSASNHHHHQHHNTNSSTQQLPVYSYSNSSNFAPIPLSGALGLNSSGVASPAGQRDSFATSGAARGSASSPVASSRAAGGWEATFAGAKTRRT